MDSTVSMPGQHRQTLLRRALLVLEQVSRFGQDSGFISTSLLKPVTRYWRPAASPHPHTSLYPVSKRGSNPTYVPFCRVLMSFFCEVDLALNVTGGAGKILIEHFSPSPSAHRLLSCPALLGTSIGQGNASVTIPFRVICRSWYGNHDIGRISPRPA